MSDIFLGYSSEDRDRAEVLVLALEKLGWSVFWDLKTPPGLTWDEYIESKLEEAGCVLVAWSAASISSDWVKEEAREGKARKILIPVLFEKVKPPFGFGGLHGVDLASWSGSGSAAAFRELVTGIERILGTAPRSDDMLERPAAAKRPAKKKTAAKKAASAKTAVARFETLAKAFFSQPLAVRREVAGQVEALAPGVPLESVRLYALSRDPGERVAAAIALRVHVEVNPKLAGNKLILETVVNGLRDSKERVRYRWAELAAKSPRVAKAQSVSTELQTLVNSENSLYVRRKAEAALRVAR